VSGPAGRVVSVNLGPRRFVPWRGQMVATGIFKEPVAGRIVVRDDHVEGDTVADRRVHGGWSKAVYAYPAEHYASWRAEEPAREWPFGFFGENLTLEGLLETDVGIGDRLRVGSAVLEVTEPRLPCMKLGIKYGDTRFIKRFLHSGRTGFYLAIVDPGDIGAGDPVERVTRADSAGTIAEAVRAVAARE
jgi:MOSC domain-containing protein YiiM